MAYDLSKVPLFPAENDFVTPLCQVDAENDEDLFKQIKTLFKQEFSAKTGKVIGLKYKMFNGEEQTLNFPQVKARYETYFRRQKGEETTRANYVGLKTWEYALSLFKQVRQTNQSDLLEPVFSGET